MSKRLLPIFAAIVALFSSCANDDETGNGGNGAKYNGALCTVPPMEFVGDVESRSSLSLGPAGMLFAWDDTQGHEDQLSIFFSETDDAAAIYTLNDVNNENKTSATFTSVGFVLSKDKRYYAINTTEGKAPQGVSLPSKRNIVLTYAGQVQKGNKNTSHLGAYNYLAASAVAENDNQASFDFQYLNLTLRIIMDGLPEGVEFTKMEMYDSQNSYLQPVRNFDMTSGLANDGTYTPALKPVDINSTSYKTSDRFSLKLESSSDPEHGIEAGSDGVASRRLEMFIEVPPANLTGKDLIFTVEGSNGKSYYIKCDGRNLQAGKAYQMKGDAKESDTYIVRVKVNHDWQLGYSLSSPSRGTGDPGVDEEFDYPQNLYYVLCVNGTARAVADSPSGKAYVEKEGVEAQWTRDKNISTYAEPLSFKFETDEDKAATKNVYVVASNNDLTSLFDGITNTTPESTIKNLVYSIQEEGLGAGFTTQEKTQAFMKNLYSTPWTTTNFVGNLGNDYFKDIILYHVAAKVDLKWNSTASVMGSTEETNKVRVNNVQSTNLSLFQPATVNGTLDHTGTNNYTVTSVIEEDRKYYGRQVFYLPQMASADPNTSTYNVTVGNKDAEDVNFTPSTTGGFTSWMRWLRQY